MKKLLKYLKNYKKESALGPLFKLLEASFELLIPLVMASIIDTGIANANKPYIIKMGIVMVILGIVGLVCSLTAQYYAAKAAVGFAAELKHALFAHIQKLSFKDIDEIGSSTLITRMTSDVNQVQVGVNLVLRLFLRSPFIVIGAMVMAFTIDVKAALIFVVTIPLLSIVVFGVMIISIPLYKKVQKNLDKVLSRSRENLTGIRVIRAFNKEDLEYVKFKEENSNLTKIQLYVGKITALMNPVTYIIINSAIAVLIYTGALRVDAGIITQGAVVALVNYMSQILTELVKLANLIVNVTKSIACGNRIQDIFEIEEERDYIGSGAYVTGDSNVHVEFRNVSLTYGQSKEEAISHVSFTALRGDTIGIIGGTGSGKSSVVNLIPRFYEATRGEVLIDGINVNDISAEELRNRVGVVMQKAVLFKGTIRDNMKWGREEATDEEIYEALDIAQAREFVDKKNKGLSHEISQQGKNLSGGQRQRLTIARALVKKSDILILDDSSSALDFATDAALRKAIRSMDNPPTTFIVSQRASSIQHANLIIVLDDGNVSGIGTHEELLKTCDVYKEIYYSQFDKEEE